MYTFFKAFSYAWNGIRHAAKRERNFKFHLVAGTIVVGAGLWTGLTLVEWFIVILLIAGMLALELMNAAIERTIDLITIDQHPLAGQAKDLAAGAVLIFAIASALIGCLIFLPKWFY